MTEQKRRINYQGPVSGSYEDMRLYQEIGDQIHQGKLSGGLPAEQLQRMLAQRQMIWDRLPKNQNGSIVGMQPPPFVPKQEIERRRNPVTAPPNVATNSEFVSGFRFNSDVPVEEQMAALPPERRDALIKANMYNRNSVVGQMYTPTRGQELAKVALDDNRPAGQRIAAAWKALSGSVRGTSNEQVFRDTPEVTRRVGTPPLTTTPSTDPPAPLQEEIQSTQAPVGATVVDTSQFDNLGTGRENRRVAIQEGRYPPGEDGYINLGRFENPGGPNIYGKASVPGGRLDTFKGTGAPGMGDGRVNNGIGYTAEEGAVNRANMNARIAASLGRGGAAPGGNNVARAVQMASNNARRAYANAIKRGLNTAAASREAEAQMTGVRDLIGADYNAAIREGNASRERLGLMELQKTDMASQASVMRDAMKAQGEQRASVLKDATQTWDPKKEAYIDNPRLRTQLLSEMGLDDYMNMPQEQFAKSVDSYMQMVNFAQNYEEANPGKRWPGFNVIMNDPRAKRVKAKYGDVTLQDLLAPNSSVPFTSYLLELVDQFIPGVDAQSVLYPSGYRADYGDSRQGVRLTDREQSKWFEWEDR